MARIMARMTSRGREELPAVVALLPHLLEQALVDLREREDVGASIAPAGSISCKLVEDV